VRDSLVSKSIDLKEIKGTHLTFDSSNIPVKVKENNLKTSIKDRFSNTKKVLSFIINDLKAKPYITRNLRREKDHKVSSTGSRICLAEFEMLYWGKYKEGNRTRLKFVCPIIHSKKFRKGHPFCPWMHPQFVKGTGCFAYTAALYLLLYKFHNCIRNSLLKK